MIDQEKNNRNVHFVCSKGCNECCNDYFYISIMEYFYIKYWLLTYEPEKFELAKEKAKEQMELLEKFSEEEYKRLFRINTDKDTIDSGKYISKFKECVFLQNGICSIYPARPHICRTYGYTTMGMPCAKIQDAIKNHDIENLLIPLNTEGFEDEINMLFTDKGMVDMRRAPIIYWLYKDEQFQPNYIDSLAMGLKHYMQVHMKLK